MKTRPILLNGDMVRAVLNGSKTQTRRVVPEKMLDKYYSYDDWCDAVMPRDIPCEREYEKDFFLRRCPFGQVGDRLYVRERMRVKKTKGSIGIGTTHVAVQYEADGGESDFFEMPARLKEIPVLGKCLSNGGPREFSRITLEITGVRVERLQDISEEDALAEGATKLNFDGEVFYFHEGHGSHKIGFAGLWDSIYGTWEQNPWVWVIEFKVVQ